MVPVPLQAGAWHEAQVDELFASLLGKGFQMAEDETKDTLPGADVDAPLRVFGESSG
jgi:protein AATF/BFR2